MKDQIICFIDLLCPDPLPTRLKENRVSQVYRKLESWRVKSKDDRATLDK